MRPLVAYRVTIPPLGTAALGLALVADDGWSRWPWLTAALVAAAFLLRRYQLPVTKFAAVHLVGLVGLGGSVLAGPAAGAVGTMLGVMLADALWLRRGILPAWINASRETIALLGAFGWYAWAHQSLVAPGAGLEESVPALAVFVVVHFVLSRALQYLSLVVRGKLLDEERALIIRFEVITLGATIVALAALLAAVSALEPLGVVVMVILVVFAGLLLKRVLEESIAAEELNTVLAMEVAVSADAALGPSIARIARMAERLIEFKAFRVLRHDGERQWLIFTDTEGVLEPPREAPADGQRLRREAVTARTPILLPEADRDPRVERPLPDAASRAVAPLVFGERVLGLVELDTPKRGAYGSKQGVLLRRVAQQLATTMHLADLRAPLAATVDRVEGGVGTLTASARTLRDRGERVVRAVAEITRGLADEREELRLGLEGMQGLGERTRAVASDANEAHQGTREASAVAAENRATVEDALKRLTEARRYAAQSAERVTELASTMAQVTGFVGVIRELAVQTNLLALNAAIEAARAGHEGRGFAVVAAEVRALADESGRAAADAQEALGAFEERMRETEQLMARGEASVRDAEERSAGSREALARIVEGTAAAAIRAARIAASAEDQRADVARMRERLNQLESIVARNASGLDAVSTASRDQADALRALERTTADLEAVVESLAELTERVTRATE